MKFLGALLILFSFQYAQAQKAINLWSSGEKPFYIENDLVEIEIEVWGTTCAQNVTEPTLTIFESIGENSGKAVLVIPGGGYGVVAMYHEGYDVAKKLSKAGITAAVLKYRLPNPKSSNEPENVPLSDARQAIKLFRSKSQELGFDKRKVGVLGFSAGSHLATIMGIWKSSNEEENPDFSVLIYGVTVPSEENIKWLEKDLYHRKMTPEEIEKNNILAQVNKETPPAFLVHSYDDRTCPVEESTAYAAVLKKYGVPVEMHLFEKGDHGFGLGRASDGTDQWVDLCIGWIQRSFN
ncbi:MAG: alpha/beta hydrolase [Reichenbachiella sp.]